MRRRFSVIVSVMLLAIFGGLFLKQNASAYWSSSNGKECFAIRYGWSNAYKREGKAAADGNVDEYQGEWKAYSTPMVCATKDSKGKITLKTSGYPADNDNIAADGTIRLKASKQTVQLTVCNRSGSGCDKTTPKSFKLSDYKNFKALAKAVVNAAPQKYGKATKGDLNDKITKTTMKEQADKKIEALKAGTTGDGTDNTATATGASGDPCFNANTNSLGWIMCPVMRTLENTAEWLDSMIEEWLSVDTSLYNANSPTASVWETMRNIANIIMVIILLVIIFSQLTGVGIDNYGIKKMLPRLIAMAILINLSLVICELAIDVSNLLGTGLKNLFGEIGKNLLAEKGTSDYLSNFVSTMVTALLAMVAGLGAIAPFGLTVMSIPFSSGGMLIVILVLALLVVVAAVLVFFVMLGARMVIIIGCVAVAPVALAFYILPNTQELYKKWLNAFKTALVVFPICGAVSGVGLIIRAIVLSADEIQVWMGVIGIIAPFLAFFMLPSMLKGVLGTLGRMGEALTMMGQGVKSGAANTRSAVQNSERYKNAMDFARKEKLYNRSGRTMNRLSNKLASGKTLSNKEISQFARAAGTRSGIDKERIQNTEALISSGRAGVDINDIDSMKKFHMNKLEEYEREKDPRKRSVIMDQIKAVQNVMSGTSNGRDAVADNFEAAIRGNHAAALPDAAAHLMANHGDTYKENNRASHGMIGDLANNKVSLATVAENLENGSYVNNSVEKYTEQTLVGADDAVFRNLISNMNNGKMGEEQLKQLIAIADRIEQKASSGNLNVKPETMRNIETIRNFQTTKSVPVNSGGSYGVDSPME